MNQPPATPAHVAFSLPFVLALAAVEGTSALLPLTGAALGRDDVARLARRVIIKVDPVLDRKYPTATPCRLTVESRAGKFVRTAEYAVGDVAAPLTDAELQAKFRTLSGAILSPDRQDAVIEGICHGRHCVVDALKAALGNGAPESGQLPKFRSIRSA